MTSPPFFLNCKHCGQEETFGDYPEWWICQRCLFKNTLHWVLFFKWISCKPINNKELEDIGRPILEDDLSKKYKSYEEKLK